MKPESPDLLRVREEIEQKAHERQLETLRLQKDLNVQISYIQRDIEATKTEATEASEYLSAVQELSKKTGIVWVDAWNGIIRPLCATIAITLWVSCLFSQQFSLTPWDRDLIGAILGFFFASRFMQKNGK
jgi:hypothetical protein